MATYTLIRDSFDDEAGEMERKKKEYTNLQEMLKIVCNVMNAPRKNGYQKEMSAFVSGDNITVVIEQKLSGYIQKKQKTEAEVQ